MRSQNHHQSKASQEDIQGNDVLLARQLVAARTSRRSACAIGLTLLLTGCNTDWLRSDYAALYYGFLPLVVALPVAFWLFGERTSQLRAWDHAASGEPPRKWAVAVFLGFATIACLLIVQWQIGGFEGELMLRNIAAICAGSIVFFWLCCWLLITHAEEKFLNTQKFEE